MAYPAHSSPISPVSLPQPYDISAAVHKALKLDLAHVNTCQNNVQEASTQKQEDISSLEPAADIDELIPNLIGSEFLDEAVWDNVTLPEDMETDAWGENTSANMEELERFCRYIDGDTETEEDTDEYNSPVKKRQRSGNKSMHQGSLEYAQVELVNSDLWTEFSQIGTEMVITKNGRRMFPSLSVQVYGLNPDAIYSIYLDILPADDRRYKFMQTEWVPVGRIDKKFLFREYIHPDSPNTGQHWMEKPILFKLLKLTNNKSTVHKDQIILNSMQKYLPSFRIKCNSHGPESRSYQFPETSFIAVTAYQNNKITQLKIDNNPYARAFRDSVASDSVSETDLKKSKNKKQTGSIGTTTRVATPVTPSPPQSTLRKYQVAKSEGSATSVESGFESGSSASEIINPRLQWMEQYQPPIPHSESPYGCPFNYWADENSLYNSALIYPPPLLDSSLSFSEPYLQQSSQMMMESQIPIISPIKPPHRELHHAGTITDFPDTEYEDDVFT